MYLLDSSAIIEILGDSEIGKKIVHLVGESLVCTTSFSLYEILLGVSHKDKERISQFFSSIDILYFDARAAEFSVGIEKELVRSGKLINKVDIFIAGICKFHNKTVISLDFDFKKIEGLKTVILNKNK